MGALNYWKDIWRYRELFFFLAWRDILVRYKQTATRLIVPAGSVIVGLVVFFYLAGHPVRDHGLVSFCA